VFDNHTSLARIAEYRPILVPSFRTTEDRKCFGMLGYGRNGVPIVVALSCAFLGAIGQLLFKLGSASVTLNPLTWLANWEVMGGLALYGVSAILFIGALKHGNLSILYPLIATSYVWVTILSVLILGEARSLLNWIGLLILVAGVALIAS